MSSRTWTILAALVATVLAAGPGATLPADRAISQYVRRGWTVEQGLPHGTVRGFAQTADGYLWLATYEGLVRFNGEDFEIMDRSNAPAMLSNSIREVLRAVDGTLWLGTNDGLMRRRDGRFETIELPGGPDMIDALSDSPDGTIWAGTAGGSLLRITGGRVEKVSLSLPNSPITALAAIGDRVWIGTSAGLHVYHRASGELARIQGMSSDRIVCLFRDREDALLAGTSGGVDRIDGETVSTVRVLPGAQVTALRRDRDGNLWVGTYSRGLYRIDERGGLAAYGIADGLLNPTVRAIFEDDEGSIWVGSNGGLEQFRAGAFVTWGKREGLDDAFVRVVFEDRDGTRWAGSAGGLYRWTGEAWTRAEQLPQAGVLAIEQGPESTRWIGTANGLYRIDGATTTLLTTADGLASNTIRDIHSDRRGNVWVATDFGVNRIRPDGRIESFAGRDGLGAEYAMAFAETPDGRIWAATGGGLLEVNGDEMTIHAAPQDFPSNKLFAIEADSDGTIWVGTDGDGLIRFRNGRASTIRTRDGLAADKVVSLAGDRQGRLWLCTVRGAFFAPKKELHEAAGGGGSLVSSRMFDENDGLGSRQCNGAANPSMLLSHEGSIWIATAKGISALMRGPARVLPARDPVVERISINGKPVPASALGSIDPGVERIEFEFTSVTFVTPEHVQFRYRLEGYDESWIDGGTKRVASYTNLPAGDYRFVVQSSRDGEHWRASAIPFGLEPRFYETRWFIAGCIVAVVALLLVLHSMRLHFSRERNRLLEKLVEDRTRQISEEKERTEQALRKAEAATIEAEEARREAERHEQLVEQALAQAESASRTKSIFLATTSHELRTPLNAIIGFSEILISSTSDRLEPRHVRFLQNILSSGEYLLGHINNILDLSKIEAGRIELQPEPILLHDVVDEISAVMKGVATLKRVTIDVQLAPNLPSLEADPTQVKQILYNLISNAVKFSPDGRTVTVSAQHIPPEESPIGESAIEIRVRDQGIGIDPKDHHLIFQEFRQAQGVRGERPQGTGLGLALVKRFVELHRGTIRVESALGSGSTFIVILPRKHRSPAPQEEPVGSSRREVAGL